ncbi:MAG TPA: Lrp/AsnC ligand binding domain-containing protein [candidate division Zixibacteria bacterium]|nr:Lrp/AsnC ligand binding domain-containing protein [candidate division Zixibacteria bacterium]
MSSPDKEIMKAYMLINVALGRTNEVLAKIKLIPSVTSVAVITGEYDIIVRLETLTMNEMYNRTQEIHLIDGIIETTTSIIQKEF